VLANLKNFQANVLTAGFFAGEICQVDV